MNYKVKTTPKFEKELKRLAKKYPSLKIEYPELVRGLKENPEQGTFLDNYCYKIHLAVASKGKGKSGGARVITYLQISETVIYLLTIYDKNEQESIPAKELKDLLKYVTQ